MNRVCTRPSIFSSFISYGDHQHWRMPRHGNLRQCSLSLCSWALHCGCSELYSVEGSPRISCTGRRHVIIRVFTTTTTIQYCRKNIYVYKTLPLENFRMSPHFHQHKGGCICSRFLTFKNNSNFNKSISDKIRKTDSKTFRL